MCRPNIQAARHVIVAPDEFRKRWDAEPTAGLLARADNICVSAGLPHFDPSYSAASMRALNNPRITLEMIGKVLYGSLLRPDESTPRHGTVCRLEKPYAIERSPREAAELLSSRVPIT
jgi:hypothetical protein